MPSSELGELLPSAYQTLQSKAWENTVDLKYHLKFEKKRKEKSCIKTHWNTTHQNRSGESFSICYIFFITEKRKLNRCKAVILVKHWRTRIMCGAFSGQWCSRKRIRYHLKCISGQNFVGQCRTNGSILSMCLGEAASEKSCKN